MLTSADAYRQDLAFMTLEWIDFNVYYFRFVTSVIVYYHSITHIENHQNVGLDFNFPRNAFILSLVYYET